MFLRPGEIVSLEGSRCCCVGCCRGEPRTTGPLGRAQPEPCSCRCLHQSVTLVTLCKPWGPRGGRRLELLNRPGTPGKRAHFSGPRPPTSLGSRDQSVGRCPGPPLRPYPGTGTTCQSSLHLSLSRSDAHRSFCPAFSGLGIRCCCRQVGGGGSWGRTEAVTRSSFNPVHAVGV